MREQEVRVGIEWYVSGRKNTLSMATGPGCSNSAKRERHPRIRTDKGQRQHNATQPQGEEDTARYSAIQPLSHTILSGDSTTQLGWQPHEGVGRHNCSNQVDQEP